MTSDNLSRFLAFIEEREAVRLRRATGEPKPWTDDSIMQQWSFCNVRREDDQATCWIRENWREPHATDPDLWFAMVVARFVNEPDTLAELGFPVPWDRERFLRVMKARKDRGDKLYRPAYMIRADARLSRPTPLYQVEDVFDPLWADRKRLRPQAGDTLADYHKLLGEYHGMGDGFMPAQIIADLKYVEPLKSAADWMSFAVSGPGSRRGLNCILGRPVDQPWTEAKWRGEFDRLWHEIKRDLDRLGLDDLHAQDLQNCLCEFFKHERLRQGGTGKRRFNGAGGLTGLLAPASKQRLSLPELLSAQQRRR